MTMTRGIAIAVLVAIAGCGGCDSVPPDAVTKCQATTIVPRPVKTDILFVVDDSGSMQVEQANLATNFQTFIDRLSKAAVKNEFQIGITTTSIDRNAVVGGVTTLVSTFGPTCPTGAVSPNAGAQYPAGALVSVDATGHHLTSGGGRILAADSPTLVQDFVRNVHVGVCGSGKEQGLRAARLALSEPLLSGANAGFLRPGAKLAVIIVSDDDDCSDPGDGQGHPLVDPGESPACEDKGEKVADFVQFLGGPIGGEVRDVVVAAIASVDPVTLLPAQCTVLNPDGSTAGTSEHAAPRYVDFATSFGTHAALASICNASFADTLQAIAGLIATPTVPLSETPADWRLLAVAVERAGGGTTTCKVGLAGDATADVIYSPPQQGGTPTLTFKPGNACELQLGDAVQVQLLCAG
jgi:hypothetical protein